MVITLAREARKPVAGKQPQFAAFARRLRELREAAGLTQAGLGELAGLHQVSIARLESGTVDAPLSTIQRLAEALGALPGDLLAPLPAVPDRPRGKLK